MEESGMIRQDDPALFAEPGVTPSIEEPAASPKMEPKISSPAMESAASSKMKVEPITTIPQEEPEKTILQEGKTLRLLALDLFGNREFWVYIYLENRDKIPDPNRVPSGTELLLPDKSAYSIDATDPQSVAKAKSLSDEILGRF